MKLICTSREIPPKSNAHNGGYVLPMVLILLIFVLGIGTVLLMRAGNAVRLSRHYLDHSYCDTLVESARAECRARLEENPSYTVRAAGWPCPIAGSTASMSRREHPTPNGAS